MFYFISGGGGQRCHR